MRTRLSIIALAALALGCSDSSTGTTAVSGDYPLASVNGGPLPGWAYHDYGYTLAILGGMISLSPDGTFRDVYDFQETTSGQTQPDVVVTCDGRWTRSGKTLTLRETPTAVCGDSATALWDGHNTLTVSWSSLTLNVRLPTPAIPVLHRR